MPTMSVTPPEPGGWTVSSQVARIQANAAGQLVPGFTIHFATAHNVASSIWVPESDYTVDNIKALIAAKVAQLDAVSELSG